MQGGFAHAVVAALRDARRNHLAGAVHHDRHHHFAAPLAPVGRHAQIDRLPHGVLQREGDRDAPLHLPVLVPSLLPAPAALTDRPLLGQALFVGFAVGAHARLGLGGGIVQRRGVRAAVVPEFLVQRILVPMTVNPAEAGTGIVFRRTDIEGQPLIPALCDYVVDASRGTTIEAGGHRVSTIEHIMSALWTLGVDNALIDIDAPEIAILDGSAREYAEAVTRTGLVDQEAERRFYHVTEKMVYTIPEKGTAIILYPDDEFSVSVHVDYNSKVIGNQYATFEPGDDYAGRFRPAARSSSCTNSNR